MSDSAPPAQVGLGAASVEIDKDLDSSHVMLALREKIVRPQDFLPVVDVVTRVSDDGAGTYREMSMQAGGGQRIIENIYHDGATIVRFVVVGDANEHVNVIKTDAATGVRTLEFSKRNTTTLEPAFWPAPMAVAVGGIHKVLARARALRDGAAPAEMAK